MKCEILLDFLLIFRVSIAITEVANEAPVRAVEYLAPDEEALPDHCNGFRNW